MKLWSCSAKMSNISIICQLFIKHFIFLYTRTFQSDSVVYEAHQSWWLRCLVLWLLSNFTTLEILHWFVIALYLRYCNVFQQLQNSTAGVLVKEQLHSWLRSKQLHYSGWKESNCTPASNCGFLQIIEDNWSRSDAFHWRQITALRIALHFISRCCTVWNEIAILLLYCYICSYCDIVLVCYMDLQLHRILSQCCAVCCMDGSMAAVKAIKGFVTVSSGEWLRPSHALWVSIRHAALSRDAQSSFQSWPRNVLHYQRPPATPLESDANLESNTSGEL